MELKITISEQDYLQYNIYHAEHAPNYRGTIIALSLLVPFLCLLGTYFMLPVASPVMWAVAAVIASAIWAFTMPRRYRKMIRKQVRKRMLNNNNFVGQFKLTAMDDHLSYEGNGEKNEISYAKVVKVVQDKQETKQENKQENKQYIYIFLGSVSALIIPPATFLDEAQRLAFLKLLREKCRGAQFI